MPISWIIPHRNEGDWLDWTLANIRRVAGPDDEIMPIEDVRPSVGVSYQRHRGIERARHNYVVIADAHMDFDLHLGANAILHLAERPRDILCFRCPGVHEETREVVESPRYGADIVWYDPNGKTALRSRWIRDWRETNEVGNILGGCYAMRRDWYLDGLGGVWQWHRAWGRSEQMISVMNYLCGGANLCMRDTWAAHYFKPKGTKRGFILCPHQYNANLMLIVYAMFDPEYRQRMWDTMRIKPAPTYGRKSLDAMGAVEAVEKWLARHQERPFSEYAERFMTYLDVPTKRTA